jgi:hypothetical protein
MCGLLASGTNAFMGHDGTRKAYLRPLCATLRGRRFASPVVSLAISLRLAAHLARRTEVALLVASWFAIGSENRVAVKTVGFMSAAPAHERQCKRQRQVPEQPTVA